jgi:tripartite-type tricarboxylate transporter receptor subunit TctC
MKAFLLAVLMALPLFAHAQAWPQRPVRFVVPLGPGSGADISARMIAERLAKQWAQPVVIENRPGGDGVVAINAVLGARDDHVLLYGPASSFVGHPYTLEKVPYDPRDLVPVARVTSTVVCLAVPAASKVTSLKEFMAEARSQPGKFNWTSVTSVTDIVVAGALKRAGVDMVNVPYRDPVGALTDLVEGRIHLYSSACAIVGAQAKGGKLRLIAVQSRTRAPGFDLPTVAEAGFPDLNFDGLVGVIAARGANMPNAARERIASDIRAVLSDRAIADKIASTGQLIVPGSPSEFAASIEEQAGHLAAFAKVLGLKQK